MFSGESSFAKKNTTELIQKSDYVKAENNQAFPSVLSRLKTAILK